MEATRVDDDQLNTVPGVNLLTESDLKDLLEFELEYDPVPKLSILAKRVLQSSVCLISVEARDPMPIDLPQNCDEVVNIDENSEFFSSNVSLSHIQDITVWSSAENSNVSENERDIQCEKNIHMKSDTADVKNTAKETSDGCNVLFDLESDSCQRFKEESDSAVSSETVAGEKCDKLEQTSTKQDNVTVPSLSFLAQKTLKNREYVQQEHTSTKQDNVTLPSLVYLARETLKKRKYIKLKSLPGNIVYKNRSSCKSKARGLKKASFACMYNIII